LPNYLPPVLMGYASGATLAYSVLAQAPHDTFAGALTLGFCPTLVMRKPPCKGSGFEFTPLRRKYHLEVLPSSKVGDPWIDLQAENDRSCKSDQVRAFIAKVPGATTVTVPKTDRNQVIAPGAAAQLARSFDELAAQNPVKPAPLPPAALGDLPVVYVPALAGTPPSDSFALIMSGDGGWAGLDEDVAAALTAKGIPVIGLDSLRYYWTPRTPEGIAADADRIIRYYLAHLQKSRVLMIGYSQGADVLPFAVNRLPPATRARVALTAIMGMSEHALFEFHLSSWIKDDDSGPATMPEVNRITGMPVLCIYGADEDDSLCPKLDPKRVSIVKVKGGHHFDGDYAGLAKLILAAAAKP
jgi:type IV secretory pathway VirJ component